MSIFALEKISPLIDAESSKSASASINGAISPDFWTYYIIEIIIELIIIKKNSFSPSDNYIKIDKFGNFADKVFWKVRAGAHISGTNDGAAPVEKVCHHGHVRNLAYFRLWVDKERPHSLL